LSLFRVGISACLLGQEVRFDGGHKRDSFLTDALGHYVEWIPVCPEVEVGMGTPREPLRLVRDGAQTRMITTQTGIDYTDRMNQWARTRVAALAGDDLDGYVLKKNSPSCGMLDVKVFDHHDRSSHDGQGLFATVLTEQMPMLPVEEEGRLSDQRLRENFVARLFAYRRLKDCVRGKWTAGTAVAFQFCLQLQLCELMPRDHV
jgi:uncharacterized protein YbbK (DUF523 family)